MRIDFANGAVAWEDFNEKVIQFIIQHKPKTIAEIGGGANPLLNLDFVKEQGIKYDVLDISAGELSKADQGFEKIVLDLEKPELSITTQYDFIFAQMTLEHIKDPHQFYTNVHKLLQSGGKVYLFFACVTSFPSLINLVMPEYISKKILLSLQPFRKRETHGKFKAYYKWCLGPAKKNIRRYQKLHFEVLSYTGYFGHSYYQRIPVLRFLEKAKAGFLLKHPNPYFCSYAHVLLKKT